MEMAEYVGTGLADLQRRTCGGLLEELMGMLFLSIDELGKARGFVFRNN